MAKIIKIAEELYAIVRVDNFQDINIEPEKKIAVKCVVSSYDFAEKEE